MRRASVSDQCPGFADRAKRRCRPPQQSALASDPGAGAVSEPQLRGYLDEARSWEVDRAAQLRRSVVVAWWVCAAGWTCAVSAAIALMILMPLKRVEPFVIRVDNSTGIVDVVPAYDARTTPQEAVTRYFLTHYLTTCERFNFSTAESDYEECGAFNSPQRNQLWYAAWTATNPASPLNVHKDGSTVRAQVESISFFTRASGLSDLAQVRYLKARRQGPGAEETFTHWIATVQYGYAEPAKEPRIRRWNPLGFKLLEFVTEPEVLNEPAAAATTASPAPPLGTTKAATP
jgi:type IV secretion system protein VirB8